MSDYFQEVKIFDIENYDAKISKIIWYIIVLIILDVALYLNYKDFFEPFKQIYVLETLMIITILVLSERIYLLLNTYLFLKLFCLMLAIAISFLFLHNASFGFLIGFMILWPICGIDVPEYVYHMNKFYKFPVNTGTYIISFNEDKMTVYKTILTCQEILRLQLTEYELLKNAIVCECSRSSRDDYANNQGMKKLDLRIQIIKNDEYRELIPNVLEDSVVFNINHAIAMYYEI